MRIYVKDMPEELGKLEFHLFDENGRKYLNIAFSDMTPLPDIPEELIDCVTRMENEIYNGFRKEGVYEHNGAKLVVTTTRHLKADVYYQRMEIIGPSVTSVNEIYTLVRQGKLQPVEDWEAPMLTVSQISLTFSKIRIFLVFLKSKLPSFSRK
ncbi:MAG TPA: hypothetical protein VMV66_03165 [Candidatus Humimicrobiaceae bacterium]|nr:hypothetical protein [Candidatus Humimicrobiaceae bacterium]